MEDEKEEVQEEQAEEQEQQPAVVGRIERFVVDYSKQLYIVFGILVIVLVGAISHGSSTRIRHDKGLSAVYSAASESEAKDIIESYADMPEISGAAMFRLAVLRAQSGKYKEALDAANEFLAKFGSEHDSYKDALQMKTAMTTYIEYENEGGKNFATSFPKLYLTPGSRDKLAAPAKPKLPVLTLDTTRGNISIELYEPDAPKTVGYLVDAFGKLDASKLKLKKSDRFMTLEIPASEQHLNFEDSEIEPEAYTVLILKKEGTDELDLTKVYVATEDVADLYGTAVCVGYVKEGSGAIMLFSDTDTIKSAKITRN